MAGTRISVTAGRVLIGVALLVSAACDRSHTTLSFSGLTMGTSYDVTVELRGRSEDTTAIGALVEGELSLLERVMSTYDPASDVSRFGAYEGTDPFPVDESLVEIVASALEVAGRSSGAFDPTVGPLVDAWGFGPFDVSPPDSATVGELVGLVGFERLLPDRAARTLAKAHPGVRIDLSGIAKGFAAERVATRLRERGYQSALVDVGGEVRVLGSHVDGRPWRIAVEGPGDAAPELLGTIDLVDESIATSGDFRNYHEEGDVAYAHIIDSRTGFPIRYRGFSVSVVHAEGTMADAWATALTVLGPGEGLSLAEQVGLAALFAWRSEEGLSTAVTTRMAGRMTMAE